MTRAIWFRRLFLLWVLAVVDAASGTLLLVWPGFWQELVHPDAMGTTFYPLQRLGVVWIARGVLAGLAASLRSPQIAFAVGVAWALDVPGEALLAWRVGTTGPYALGVHLSRAVLAAIIAYALIRAGRARRTGKV